MTPLEKWFYFLLAMVDMLLIFWKVVSWLDKRHQYSEEDEWVNPLNQDEFLNL